MSHLPANIFHHFRKFDRIRVLLVMEHISVEQDSKWFKITVNGLVSIKKTIVFYHRDCAAFFWIGTASSCVVGANKRGRRENCRGVRGHVPPENFEI